MSPRKGETTAKADVRRFELLQAAKAGTSQKRIAEVLGVSQQYVSKETRKLLDDLARENSNAADKVRALQNERLTHLVQAYWTKAVGFRDDTGNTIPPDLKAADYLLKVLDRISAINGVIPDQPLINVDQRQITVADKEMTFSIERASSRPVELLKTPKNEQLRSKE
tara:strand:- start:2740 stop:3240 length:501 start_codon:yes stop_codon:yes gene_type:complete